MSSPKKIGAVIIPVPKSVKTNRTIPRLVATVTICASVFTAIVGIRELAKLSQQNTSPIDQIFQIGTRAWKIVANADQGHCLGFLYSEVRNREKPQLNLRGVVALPLYQKAFFASLDLAANFSEQKALDSLVASFQVGGNKARISTLRTDINKLLFELETPYMRKSIEASRPNPIYLVEIAENRFNIRLPQQLQGIIKRNEVNLSSYFGLPGFMFTELELEQLISCKNQVLAIDENYSFDKGVLDIGPLINLLGIKPTPAIVESLRIRPKWDSK